MLWMMTGDGGERGLSECAESGFKGVTVEASKNATRREGRDGTIRGGEERDDKTNEFRPTSAAVWSFVSSLGLPRALFAPSSSPSSADSVSAAGGDILALFRGLVSGFDAYGFFALPALPVKESSRYCSALRMARSEGMAS